MLQHILDAVDAEKRLSRYIQKTRNGTHPTSYKFGYSARTAIGNLESYRTLHPARTHVIRRHGVKRADHVWIVGYPGANLLIFED
jgi:hypothetical protein